MPSIDSSKLGNKLFGEKEYLAAFLNSNQTVGLSAGDPIRFDIVRGESSSYGLKLVPASYYFTLPPNGTYKLMAVCGASSGAGPSSLQTRWYNLTSALYFTESNYGINYSPTYSSDGISQPITYAVVKTGSTSVNIQLRIINQTNVQGIVANHTFAYIEKMEETVPVKYSTDYWDDLRFPAQAINPPGPTTPPTWDDVNIGWSFSASATNSLQVIAQLPHSYKEGTAIYPHVHFEPSNTDTGNCLWRIGWRWRNNGETAAALTNQDLLVAANGTALTLQVSSFTPLAKSAALISSIVEIQLSRIGGDGTDTFTGNAILKEFDIHFQMDSSGSLTEFAK